MLELVFVPLGRSVGQRGVVYPILLLRSRADIPALFGEVCITQIHPSVLRNGLQNGYNDAIAVDVGVVMTLNAKTSAICSDNFEVRKKE
jgi:hypothetical protein